MGATVMNGLEHILIFEENEENRRNISRTIQEVLGTNRAKIEEAGTLGEYRSKLSNHWALVVFDGDALSDADPRTEVTRLHGQGSKVLVLLQDSKPPEYRHSLVRHGAVGSLIKPQTPNSEATFFDTLRNYLEHRVMNVAELLKSIAVIGAGNAGKAVVCEAVRIPAVNSVLVYSSNSAEADQARYSGQTTAVTTGRTGGVSVAVATLEETESAGTRLITIGKKGLEQRIFEDANSLERDITELETEHEAKKAEFIKRAFINLYRVYAPDIIDLFSSRKSTHARNIIVTNPVAPLVMLANIVATKGDFKELGNTNIEGLCYVDYSRCVSLMAEWWQELNEKKGITHQDIHPKIKIMGLHGFGTVALDEVMISNYHTEALSELLSNPEISKDRLLRAPFERGMGAARKANGTYTPTETGVSVGAAIRSILGDRESYACAHIRPREHTVLREGSFKMDDKLFIPYATLWDHYFPNGYALDVPGMRMHGRFIPDRAALSRSLPEDDRRRLGSVVSPLLEMRTCMVDDAIENIRRYPSGKYVSVYRNVLKFFGEKQPA